MCVGLTMKSIDSFEAGLPLLNTIGGNTWDWVEERGAGFNTCTVNVSQTAQKAVSVQPAALEQMRRATRSIYDDFLSVPAIQSQNGGDFR